VAWLWILIVVVVIIGVIAVVLSLRYMGKRGAVVTGGWLAEAIDVYAKGSALHDEMSAAVHSGASATDGAARWADIDRRADDLAQALSTMRDTGADPEDRNAAAAAFASLQAVRSALDAYYGASGPAEQAEVVRRLAGFEQSLRALRSPHSHLW
jgi:hypothetical protein